MLFMANIARHYDMELRKCSATVYYGVCYECERMIELENRILIDNIYAREVLDSNGNPTVEVEVKTNKGQIGKAIVPSDILDENEETVELRDNERKRYNGKGVQNAVNNVNKVISKELIGMNVLEQLTIDNYLNYLDGTNNKSSLGVNAILLSVPPNSSINSSLTIFITC